MSTMSILARAAIVCALASLTACGGGGGDSGDTYASPSSQLPADGYLSVDGGTSNVKAGAYALDVAYNRASGTEPLGSDTVEFVRPESPAFDVGFVFSPVNAQKFAVWFDDNTTTTFVCRSGAWSTAEAQELAAPLGKTDLPVCQSGMTIDTSKATHRIQLTGMRVPSLNDPAQYVRISANFGWVLQSQALSGNGSGSVSGGSSTNTGGSIVITSPVVSTPAPTPSPAPTVTPSSVQP